MIHLMLGVHLTPMTPAGQLLQYVRRASRMCANVCIRGDCCRQRSTQQPLRASQTSLPSHCMEQVARHGIKSQGRQLPAGVLRDQIFRVRTTVGVHFRDSTIRDQVFLKHMRLSLFLGVELSACVCVFFSRGFSRWTGWFSWWFRVFSWGFLGGKGFFVFLVFLDGRAPSTDFTDLTVQVVLCQQSLSF